MERRLLNRYVFFYPYARFAIRWAASTLPHKHPVKLAMIGRIGAFTEAEQRELLGVKAGEEDLMYGLMFGRVFFRDGDEMREHNIKSANPFGNPITEATGSQSFLGTFPPYVQQILGQILKRDLFRDRKFNVDGK